LGNGKEHKWSKVQIKRGYPVSSEGTGLGKLFMGYKARIKSGEAFSQGSVWNNPAFKIMKYNEERWLASAAHKKGASTYDYRALDSTYINLKQLGQDLSITNPKPKKR